MITCFVPWCFLFCLPKRPLRRLFVLPLPPPEVPPPPEMVVVEPLLVEEPPLVEPPPLVEEPPLVEPPPLPLDPPPLRLGSWVSGSGLLVVGVLVVVVVRGRLGAVTSTPPTLSELAVPAPITASVLPKATMEMSLLAIVQALPREPERSSKRLTANERCEVPI